MFGVLGKKGAFIGIEPDLGKINLDVYIRKIRQYLIEDERILIQTLKGKGYLFLVPSDPESINK